MIPLYLLETSYYMARFFGTKDFTNPKQMQEFWKHGENQYLQDQD